MQSYARRIAHYGGPSLQSLTYVKYMSMVYNGHCRVIVSARPAQVDKTSSLIYCPPWSVRRAHSTTGEMTRQQDRVANKPLYHRVALSVANKLN